MLGQCGGVDTQSWSLRLSKATEARRALSSEAAAATLGVNRCTSASKSWIRSSTSRRFRAGAECRLGEDACQRRFVEGCEGIGEGESRFLGTSILCRMTRGIEVGRGMVCAGGETRVLCTLKASDMVRE